MTIKLAVAFEVEVDSPATITAYGIALGYALTTADRNAEHIVEHDGAQVRQGEVSVQLVEASHG